MIHVEPNLRGFERDRDVDPQLAFRGLFCGPYRRREDKRCKDQSGSCVFHSKHEKFSRFALKRRCCEHRVIDYYNAVDCALFGEELVAAPKRTRSAKQGKLMINGMQNGVSALDLIIGGDPALSAIISPWLCGRGAATLPPAAPALPP